ncbi:MAG: alpha/beta hydrolase [Candidatus Bathyarchaeota archaeon]|nr:alpha/beta hydrolase [Candidatus Bathyarchaeota archaeon]
MLSGEIEDKIVSWRVLDIPVYGTLTVPTDKNIHGAVVFVAGSGPTDRDWCSPLLPGSKGSGKLLADALAKQGFITLRYDKVASGPHIRENITRLIGKISMQSHMQELEGAVETILAQENVDKNNLFVLTNSEGAIHAVNYQLQAKNNRFKGLVLTGAPGRSVGELGRSQIFEQIKNLPNAENIMKLYDDAIAEFLADKPVTIDASLPDLLKMVLGSLSTPANLPFSRELWMYCLPEQLARIVEPTLVVIGKKDIQVDWQIDGELLQKATSQNRSVSFAYPEHANHVLKHEETPKEQLNAQAATLNYNSPNTQLDTEAAEAIYNWLKKQVA